MSEYRFESRSDSDTIEIGGRIAGLLSLPKLLILRGDLGAGKTTLVKGIAQALGAADPDEVTSPTFTLIHEYEGVQKRPGEQREVALYHLDLYRIDSERQLETLGLEELVTENSLVLVEWGEKFPTVVGRSDGEISIEHAGGDNRVILLTLKEEGAAAGGKTPFEIA